MMQNYSLILKECRKYAGLTQKEVAEKAHLSVNSIFLYEHGKSVPTVDKFEAIINACGVKLALRQKRATPQ